MPRILILILAIISGLGTWYLLSANEVKQQAELQAAEPVTVSVLVYSRDLSRGTRLNRNAFKWDIRLASTQASFPLGSFKTDLEQPSFPSSVVDMLLRSNVSEGDIVRSSQLITGSASFMALSLSPGMRAVAINISVEEIAGGYILPNDRVDVLHTIVRDIDGDGFANGNSQAILQNVRVLAIGEIAAGISFAKTADEQDARSNKKNEAMAIGGTITLELTEEQSRVLLGAKAVGNLSLTLRATEKNAAAEIGNVLNISELISPELNNKALTDGLLALPTITIIEGGQTRSIIIPTMTMEN